MLAIVLPLRAVLFQILFLMIAVATESSIFHHRWRVSRKTSMEYAIALNLFSTTIGWLLFFIALPLLPVDLKQQIINFIFFNYFKRGLDSNVAVTYGEVTLIIVIAFILSFIIELQGINILQNARGERLVEEQSERKRPDFRYPPVTNPVSQLFTDYATDRSIPTTLLIANALSGTCILIILSLINFVTI